MPETAFPFRFAPAYSWRTGARAFSARRSGGRAHAGCDLYARAGTHIHAIADGVVVHAPALFYAKTDSVTIDHGFVVVRYGEIEQGNRYRLRKGQTVKAGQVIARVGHLVGIRVPSDMLHFEAYAGGVTGSLSRRWGSLRALDGRPYRRRPDLFNPSAMLDALRDGEPIPFPTLHRGHRGAAVVRLQARLAAREWLAGPVDGDFGKGTEAAVKAYQRSRGVAADGVAGPVTCLPLGLAHLDPSQA